MSEAETKFEDLPLVERDCHESRDTSEVIRERTRIYSGRRVVNARRCRNCGMHIRHAGCTECRLPLLV